MKKILSSFLALTLAVSAVNVSLAESITEQNSIADDIISAAAVGAEDYGIATIAQTGTAYPVEGGNIYFDEVTGTIVSADKNITSAVIPESINGVQVTAIGNEAFQDCNDLISINLPDCIKSLGSKAFYYCTSLESIDISKYVQGVYYDTLEGCKSLKSINVDKANEYLVDVDGVLYYKDMSFLVKYPAKRPGGTYSIDKATKTIWENAFDYCDDLKEIIIPDGLNRIDYKSFYNCTNLEKINVPKSALQINMYAFMGCDNNKLVFYIEKDSLIEHELKNYKYKFKIVYIDNKGNTIYPVEGGNIYFDEATETIIDVDDKITSAVIPEEINGIKVTGIGDKAFEQCKSLKNIVLPDTVESIGEYAFNNCQNLVSITMPDSVTEMGVHIFQNCSSITEIRIPLGMTTVPHYTFSECKKLEKVILQDNITSIGSNAFEFCIELKDIVLPDSVTSIEVDAFRFCSSLEKINIPEGVTRLNARTFHGCTALRDITLPESLTYISNRVFWGCNNLKSLIIPENVTNINDEAFLDCDKEQLILSVVENSYADQWAKKNGFKTIYIEKETENTESSSETTSEEASTEATTKPATSGGGGGGGGSSSSRTTTTTTTTEATTEVTTEITTAKAEKATETTTAAKIASPDVRVSIGSKTVEIGNDKYTVDAAAYIQSESNSTLVPLRFVALAVSGGNVADADNSSIISWDAVTKTATITADNKVIKFTAGSYKMTVDNKETVMENGVKAEIKDGRMFVPFRALGNALGVDVGWNAETKTAIYKTK